jgi:hypothetical protein
MPFVEFSAAGDVIALFLEEGNGRTRLPLSDLRVLRFMQTSDPQLGIAMLNASDDAHHLLLSSLIALLIRKKILSGTYEPDPNSIVPHQPLLALINAVETDDEQVRHSLEQSDRSTARIIEDVIDTLQLHGVISLHDLPKSAQQLLEVRRALRAYLSENEEDIERDVLSYSG